ncbi:hypothetical protein TNIN_446001 [Trichonephila inaurata madagascariensis]|uniref:Uncharacterized protein n=1 Tax=Trichonephila inaurata madagascariensis TaxID=2747483 RepID=A0A8X6Y2E1_9ARAC|nr:hypothetical protein TNIN_446001 [Trichonephila inaurata madagascariensis]
MNTKFAHPVAAIVPKKHPLLRRFTVGVKFSGFIAMFFLQLSAAITSKHVEFASREYNVFPKSKPFVAEAKKKVSSVGSQIDERFPFGKICYCNRLIKEFYEQFLIYFFPLALQI